MKLNRTFPKKQRFLSNFVKVVVHDLEQLKPIRWIAGGVWVKHQKTWVQVSVLREYDDGSLLLAMCTNDGSSVSFHSTNISITGLEDYR